MKLLREAVVGLLLLASPTTEVLAQSTPATTTLAVTGTSGSVALPAASGNPFVILQNEGAVGAYYGLGTTAPTVVANSTTPLVPAGGCHIVFANTGAGFLGAITASGTTTLRIIRQTQGPAPISCPGAGGGGSSTVVVAPVAIVPTDRGGILTAGGTAQQLAASNGSRKLLTIENGCTTSSQGGIAAVESIFISVTGNATVGGAGNYAELGPCGSTSVVVSGQVYTGAVTINATTIGHRWMSTEWQ